MTFATRCRGAVGVQFVPLDDAAGIDPQPLVGALRAEGYNDWVSIHQPLLDGETVDAAIGAAVRQFLPLI